MYSKTSKISLLSASIKLWIDFKSCLEKPLFSNFFNNSFRVIGDDQIFLSSSSFLKKLGSSIVLNNFLINSSADTGCP